MPDFCCWPEGLQLESPLTAPCRDSFHRCTFTPVPPLPMLSPLKLTSILTFLHTILYSYHFPDSHPLLLLWSHALTCFHFDCHYINDLLCTLPLHQHNPHHSILHCTNAHFWTPFHCRYVPFSTQPLAIRSPTLSPAHCFLDWQHWLCCWNPPTVCCSVWEVEHNEEGLGSVREVKQDFCLHYEACTFHSNCPHKI